MTTRTAPCLVLAVWLASLLGPGHAPAAPVAPAAQPVDGVVVPINLPVTTDSTNRLRSLLQGHLKRFEAESAQAGGTFTVLCDLNPEGRKAESEDFGACFDLATYLRGLSGQVKGVRTVAFVHGSVRRHSVLLALACNEIVLARKPEAVLGPVAAVGKAVSRVERTAYDELTQNRFPAVVIRKLYDPTVEVLRVGDRLADGADKPRPRGVPVPGLGRGEPAALKFDLAREAGLAQQMPRDTLEDVRGAYGVGRAMVARALDRSVCVHIPLEGEITGALREQFERRLDRALRGRASVIVLELKCGDGSSETAYEMGRRLAALNADRQDDSVETVAYVTDRARNTAAFLAFACDRMVFQLGLPEEGQEGRRPAVLGGFERYIADHAGVQGLRQERARLQQNGGDPARRADLDRQIADALADLELVLGRNLADLASRQRHPAALAEALARRDFPVHLAEPVAGGGARVFVSGADLARDEAGPRAWRDRGPVPPEPGDESGYLSLGAERARDLGVAAYAVRGLPEVFETEGFPAAQVRKADADWLDWLADFLRSPLTSVILVMVGITCLVLELKMPGVGLPGVLAAICFVLFFWSHSELNGQAVWLGVLLFVLGLLLLGLEIFILPGFGVCGVSGVVLVLASLGLVAYGRWPSTGPEWLGFAQKLSPFGVSLLGAMACIALTLRYLPHIPFLNRLAHRPTDEGSDGPELVHPGHAELAALLGAIGVAATPLRPAGKAQFGDDFVDVLAEGGYVVPGTRVQVVEVEANRVVVKEV